MRRLVALAIIVAALIPQAIAAQTPDAPGDIAESDALWGGNAVTMLPRCDGASVCLASLEQRQLGDEYYYGIVYNPTDDTMHVDTLGAISVTLTTPSGQVAGIGTSVMVTPSILSPHGHAIAMITVVGDHPREFAYEATVAAHADDGYARVPIRISHAEVQGNGVLGQMVNTTGTDAEMVSVNGLCFAPNGSILTWFTDMRMIPPLAAGESTLFAAEVLDDVDCSRFVVIAEGF